MFRSNCFYKEKLINVLLFFFAIINALFSLDNYANHRNWYEAGKVIGDNSGWMRYNTYRNNLLSPSGKLIAAGNPFTYADFNTFFIERDRFSGMGIKSPQSVLLIFNKGVFDYLADCDYIFSPSRKLISTYIEHLRKKYSVIVCTYDSPFMDREYDPVNVNDCPPDYLRRRIQEYYTELKGDTVLGTLVGCIFIGELPVKWYINKGEDTEAAALVDFEFPIDMFFMDMDGTWLDGDSDGMLDGFETYPGIDPEIWVGRITASRLLTAMQLISGQEGIILEDYFNKNVFFRENDFNTGKKAVFLKGSNSMLDSSTRGSSWLGKMIEYYGEDKSGSSNVLIINSDTMANKMNFFKSIIPDENNVNFVHIDITSSSFNHSFYIPIQLRYSLNYITSTELHQKDLKVPYYYITGAACARYIEDNYIGGAYIFTSNHRRIPQSLTDTEFNTILGRLAGTEDYDFINGTAYENTPDVEGKHKLLVGLIPANIRDSNRVARILIRLGMMNYAGGLTLVGSTKSFSLANPAVFYKGLRIHRSFGYSLIKALEKDSYDYNDVKSLFGMTIIGDPTLSLSFENDTQKAIDKGIEWVTGVSSLKNGKGGTLILQSQANGALSAMTALVLLNRGINNLVVDEALAYLTTQWTANDPAAGCLNVAGDEAWIVRPNGIDSVSVYSTSMAILALVASHPDPDSSSSVERNRYEILRKMNNFLINCQTTAAGHNYFGGFRYSKAYVNSSADNSNTQFALMGIYAASMELLPGGIGKIRENFPQNVKDVFARAKVWLDNTKAGANAGHQYIPTITAYNKTMSAAAAWSLMLVTGDATTANEDFNYLATLPDLFTFTNLPDPGYYAWTLANACVLSKNDTPIPGKDNWYNQLTEALLNYQTINGNWPDLSYLSGEHAESISTLFALLALETKVLNDADDISKVYILSGSTNRQIKTKENLYKGIPGVSRDPGELSAVPADMRLYDVSSGCYTGIDMATGKIYEQIPGSRFKLLDINGNPAPYAGGPVPDGYSLEIDIWMPEPGSYRLEITGTKGTVENPALYQLDVVSVRNETVESDVRFNSEIITGEVHYSMDEVAVINGGIPNEPSPPERSAIMALEPAEDTYALSYGQSSLQGVFRVKEIGGAKKICSLRVSCITGLDDANGTDDILPSMINISVPPDTDIIENGCYDVIFTISNIPAGFDGPSTGIFRVDADDGLFKEYKYTIIRN